MKIYLYYIGKARDTHANAMAAEYIKRSTRFATCEMREIHPDRFDPWTKHPTALKILLDPEGRAMDSKQVVSLFDRERADRDLIFIIGGSDGLTSAWRAKADLLMALSPMTMPHELARVILAEQIYRALTTLRGHPYPR
ncbi:MAG: 23S rRNA (pseudouridine(1915)-N(3))-methyltransferase RlmH [Acidobacteriota bacterium]